ncbi:MAG: hypothetical protein JWL69_1855 [Phycisphaerales bacterium]|nr:hypothetical protein [Phycisphaerales bacterium]
MPGVPYLSPSVPCISVPPRKPRQMVPAELLGAHTHRTTNAVDVHVWLRDGRYLARGRYGGRAFGATLGTQPEAAARLRRLLVEMETGSFLRPSEARNRPLKHGPPPRLRFRELVDRHLALVRKLHGKNTARDYQCRLTPAIEFAEGVESRRLWPTAAHLDGSLEFAIGLKAFLHNRTVSRNGHAAAPPTRMSARHIHNILSAVGTMLNQAKRPDVNQLASTFANPFTRAIVGERPHRDPLQPAKLPVAARLDLVRGMDAWQLATLSWSMVLPGRPEEFAGLLIGDVSRQSRELVFASRWGGDDHTKTKKPFRICYPPQFDPIVNWLIGGRTAGPLLRRRTTCAGRRRSQIHVDTLEQINAHFDAAIARAATGEVQNSQDRKRVFRRLLLDLGGVDEDDLANEFRAVLRTVHPDLGARFYDLRSAVITGLREAGVSEILRYYVCGRSLGRNTAVHYEAQDLHGDMGRYFGHVGPLIDAIATRAREVGIS